MTVKEKIINILGKDSLGYSKPDNLFLFIAKALSLKFEVVKIEVEQLIKSGDVCEIRKGKFIVVPSHGYVKGRFIGNPKGYGFVEVKDQEEDVFIPGNKNKGALDGDFVIVKTYSRKSEGLEGEVVSIFKPVEKIVGVVSRISRNLFLEPSNAKINCKFVIKKSHLEFNENDRVVAKVTRGDKGKMSAQVVEVLGQCDDVKALELGIIRQYNLYEVFPDEVIEASKKIPDKVLEKQLVNRLDLRKQTMFTIDGRDARDFDDAVSIKKQGEFYELGVHIADVGEYVKVGSLLDEEAFRRGTSTYFPTSVLPMLPVSLSNGICSLNEKVDRLTLSCIMKIDAGGKVVDYNICESVINSSARLTYKEVYEVLCGEKNNKASKFKKELLIMEELAKILEDKKKSNGALDLDIPEPKFVFDEKGYVIGVEKRDRNWAHKLIEEFMIIANETVAKEFCLKQIPFVYRVHEIPTKEKLNKVIDFMKGLALNPASVPRNITPKYYQSLLELVKGKDCQETVNKVILRSLQKAKYSRESLGHFGLSLTYYAHFTSPIRRYPDLTIHRIIKEMLKKKTITKTRKEQLKEFAYESALQSSETEKNADRAERDVDDLWKAYLMKDRVGEVFEATITSVTSFGFFVGLENSVEGLVKIETLPRDGYLFFEKSLMLKGHRMSFRIGDKLKVKLTSSNIFTRKIDFEVII